MEQLELLRSRKKYGKEGLMMPIVWDEHLLVHS